jgi:hypothetical protein
MYIQFYLHSQVDDLQTAYVIDDDDIGSIDVSRIHGNIQNVKDSKSDASLASSMLRAADMKGSTKVVPTTNKNSNNKSNVIDMKNKHNEKKKKQEEKGRKITCGCPQTCTEQILLKGNSNYSCQTRIQKLMIKYKMSEYQACEMASSSSSKEESDQEGSKPCSMECNPSQCHTLPPPKTIVDCGCPQSCDERALHKRNKQFMCIDRIMHLINKKNVPELEACEAASQDTYNYNDTINIDINKPCEYECHPKHCTNMKSRPIFQNITNVNLPTDHPFTKYDKVVIVTKVLDATNINLLIQMLCLFNAAYNRFVHYDIIVFTTVPFPLSEVERVQEMAYPSSLKVVTEGKSLQEHVDEMTQEEINHLKKRCHVKDNETISWSHHCEEENTPHVFSLGYAWQAEFRSYHLWTHAALKPYKYMMWLDADAMCSKTWDHDPMKVMIENDLILMYDQFPGGYVRGDVLKQKIKTGYNLKNDSEVICDVQLDEEKGILKPTFCKNDKEVPSIKQVYGFHHITNLDVYRQEKHQRFLKELINNDYKFSRLWDDQLAVTLPAVMENPSKCWDYRLHGLHMGVRHNGRVDGKEHPKHLSYLNYWAHNGKYEWPAARAMCDGLVTVIS